MLSGLALVQVFCEIIFSKFEFVIFNSGGTQKKASVVDVLLRISPSLHLLIVEGNDRVNSALTKWSLDLIPSWCWVHHGSRSGKSGSVCFDPFLRDSRPVLPTGSSNAGCVMPCLWDIAQKRSLATLQKRVG